MEYSIWLFYDTIWSTPFGRNLRPYGVLHNVVKNVYCWRNTKNSTRLIFATPWSTPCGQYFMPHGVLHMVVFWYHMECFRIHHRGQILLPYGVLHMAVLWCHMEYSIGLFYDAIWSTPYGSNSRPYGVLHRALKTSLMELFAFLPQLTWMVMIWSTPYGRK